MALSRDQILAAQDRKLVEVDVPEWGGVVYLRTASLREWEQAVQAGRLGEANIDGVRFASAVLAACICDENGKQLFTQADIDAIEGKSRLVVQRLFDRCQNINGFGDRAEKELEGNSPKAGEDSSSA